jgi:hypothetical protein
MGIGLRHLGNPARVVDLLFDGAALHCRVHCR